MTASLLRTRTLSAAGALDRRLHTSPVRLTFMEDMGAM
jgi:hypothetical protein